ncbi:MAG: TRAP transporter fused permease subunit [Acetobacterales bacterium]
MAAVALLMSAYHLQAAYLGEPVAEVHRPTHLLFALVIIFWATAPDGRRWYAVAADILLTGLTIGACGYLILHADTVQQRMYLVDPLTTWELVFSCGIVVAVLEAVRRTVGMTVVALVVAFLLYAVFGNLLPHPFWHRGFAPEAVLETIYLSQDSLWGPPLAVTASYIFLFVLFGSFLVASGAGSFFTEMAHAFTARSVGGPAKTAVVSSAFMGMLSGSATANVVTTGSFTIPAMKRAGYRASFAGGVEAVASSGGQFTPPIMGAAAFLMIEFTGISYVHIMAAAVMPALLYFIAVYLMVHFEARRLDIRPQAGAEVPSVLSLLRARGYLILAVGTMLYALVDGYTPARAALWAIVSLLVLLSVLDGESRRRLLRICVEAMTEAPRVIGPVTAAVAAGGILVGVIGQTGLGHRLSTVVLALAGNSQLLLLVLTMLVGVVLGMGMPTSGAYIVLAALLAPGMVSAGIPVLSAHMFIIFCAAISSITPPVAVASYAAAAIAGADPWRTSVEALRVGLSSFIIPYMFVYGPQLLGVGSPLEIAGAFIAATIGVSLLSASMVGWLWVPLRVWERLAMLALSLLLILPGWVTDGIGLSGAALVLLVVRWRARGAGLPTESVLPSGDSGPAAGE